MNNIKNTEEQFKILRKIDKKPNLTQRELAEELGFSLGKLNYCLVELKKKGLVKIQSFKNNPSKIRYVLTPRGISLRTKLTVDFMNRKMKEYDELKKELDQFKSK